MFLISIKIIILLILSAIIGFILGYLFCKLSNCNKIYNKENLVDKTATYDNNSAKKSIETKEIFQTTKKINTPDDLKQIKGIGVKIEEALNELGINSFYQIANWTNKDVNWIDRHLVFKGRIKREEWIEQAKVLLNTKNS